MTGADFGLPQQSRVFLARIRLGRKPATHIALLFTSSSKSKNQTPDELRVAVGETIDFASRDSSTIDFSSIEPISAEAPVPTLGRRQNQTRFTNVRFDFSHAGKQYPLTMDITLYAGGGSVQYAMYQFTTVRVGKIELDGKIVKAVLVDGNGNGLFNDSGQRGRGDVLLIDANNSGKLERVRGQGHYDFGGEIFPVTPMLRIDSQYYKCVIPPNGASLSLESVEPELGNIVAGGKNMQLLGPVYVNTAAGKSETITVPIGKYNLLKLNETRLDKSGRKWSVDTGTGGQSKSTLEVKAGQTASLPQMGLIKVIAQIHSQGENRRYIRAEFRTDQGLMIINAQVGRKRPKAPKYEIHDSDGKLITSGNLEYG